MSDGEEKIAGKFGGMEPQDADMLAAVEGGFPVTPGPGGLPPRGSICDHRPVIIVKKKNGRYVRQYDENNRPPNANSRYQYYVQAPIIVTAEQLKALMCPSSSTFNDKEAIAAVEKTLGCDPTMIRWHTTDKGTYALALSVNANMTGSKGAAAAAATSSSSAAPLTEDDFHHFAVLALIHDSDNLFYVGRRILPPPPAKTSVETTDADGNKVVEVTDDAKACIIITVAEMYLKSKMHKARMMRTAVASIQRVLQTDNVWCSGSNKIEIRGKMPTPEQIKLMSILPGLGNIRVADAPTEENAKKGLTTPTGGALLAEGAGGLPVLHDQNVVCLMSGGLDSPVAAYQMMVRGCTVSGVHYLNSTNETSSVMDKNRLIAKRMSEIQGVFQMRFVDISQLQAEIVARIRPLNRTLLYKWYMLYISGLLDSHAKPTSDVVAVSNSRKALAAAGKPPVLADERHQNLLLVVGDSVGQVASQTPQNIYSLYSMQAMAAAAVCIEKVGTMRGGDDSSDEDDSDAEEDDGEEKKPKAKKKKLAPHIGLDGEAVPRSAKATTLDRAFKDMIFKPVIAPLVGSNKMDIVDIARKIGTYELSILPGGDCCQYMMCKVGANLGIGRKVLKGSVKVIPQLTLPIVAETYRNGELECTHEEVLVLEPPFKSEAQFKGIAALRGTPSSTPTGSPTTAAPVAKTAHIDPVDEGIINFDVAAGGDMCAEAANAFVNAPRGNPNSLHRTGREARMAVEKVRSDIANKLNSGLAGNWVNDVVAAPTGVKNSFKSADFLFTSGGTESNNIALNGCRVIRDEWSHPSTKGKEQESAATANLPAVQVYDLVHHETGSVRTTFPKHPDAVRIHVDASQGLCKVDLSKIDFTNVDTIAFSSHKINGPQGVGILYIRDAEKRLKDGTIRPLVVGGNQEHSIRPGTENVQGIMGFGAALAINRRQAVGTFRKVEKLLTEGLIGMGCTVNRLPDTPTSGYVIHATLPVELTGMNVSFVSYLSTVYGIEIGTGSACKSGSSEENTATYNHLIAMGVNVGGDESAPIPHKRAIRLSYDYSVTTGKAEKVLASIGLAISHFKKTQSPASDGNAGARVNKH